MGPGLGCLDFIAYVRSFIEIGNEQKVISSVHLGFLVHGGVLHYALDKVPSLEAWAFRERVLTRYLTQTQKENQQQRCNLIRGIFFLAGRAHKNSKREQKLFFSHLNLNT